MTALAPTELVTAIELSDGSVMLNVRSESKARPWTPRGADVVVAAIENLEAMAAALSGKAVVYDEAAQTDDEVVAGQWNPRGKRNRRDDLSNDFTRALFGF